jgi:erythromycin esterase-like protein
VDECHYNVLLVESGIYDFIHIQKILKSGQDATDAMLSAAIGGLWASTEVQPLVPFLRERVKAGSLTLGGLDDQIGVRTYASRDMAFDLVQYLQGGERSRCLSILQRHLSWQYTADVPYGPSDKAKIVDCLNEIEGRPAQAEEGRKPSAEEDNAMIESLKRNLARDFTEDQGTKSDQEVKSWNDRDRSMYLNFKWLCSRLPPHSKVIVWASTVHVAKELSGVNGFEGKVPFWSYIRRNFGDRAFSLGFSAYSGDYAFVHQPVREFSAAPAFSLEGQAFAHCDSDTVYLSRNQLRKYGSVAARPLGTSFNTAHWENVLDGLVIFRKEHAPGWLTR